MKVLETILHVRQMKKTHVGLSEDHSRTVVKALPLI